ncbi:hypothetical protein SARC_03725 [Sphaeroforma arctica JP610]|uniref:Uncharacterized protein n=1 Tax=Sphaeroforma arctica JP610 TaxID=667725 RepID=A0A0L0G736_9EUKA|nr:hypothetical protein SARC_03725 [Sphaeroforma arctica JP610]KNC84038.1 hypothetical protein SARC_03725 [Sphaeroforma arctica JP610]|eukprot:XP_014157940.1 hypothetical protein SARC_03725 [Sphaeroforma arctica JP610]
MKINNCILVATTMVCLSTFAVNAENAMDKSLGAMDLIIDEGPLEVEASAILDDIEFNPELDLNIHMNAFGSNDLEMELDIVIPKFDEEAVARGTDAIVESDGNSPTFLFAGTDYSLAILGSLLGIFALIVCGITLKKRNLLYGPEGDNRLPSPTQRRAYRRATWSTSPWVSGKPTSK